MIEQKLPGLVDNAGLLQGQMSSNTHIGVLWCMMDGWWWMNGWTMVVNGWMSGWTVVNGWMDDGGFINEYV